MTRYGAALQARGAAPLTKLRWDSQMTIPITEFGEVEEKVREQLLRCTGGAVAAVLCADAHYGYSQPVGAAIAYKDAVSPSGVGYDIACGNKAVKTDFLATNFEREHVERVMDDIVRTLSF